MSKIPPGALGSPLNLIATTKNGRRIIDVGGLSENLKRQMKLADARREAEAKMMTVGGPDYVVGLAIEAATKAGIGDISDLLPTLENAAPTEAKP